MENIADLAKAALTFFDRLVEDMIEKRTPGAPEWIVDAMVSVSGNMAADDPWRISFLYDALENLSLGTAPEKIEPVADEAPATLLEWLGSDTGRLHYVDRFKREQGHRNRVIEEIGGGQLIERKEVLDKVATVLTERLAEMKARNK